LLARTVGHACEADYCALAIPDGDKFLLADQWRPSGSLLPSNVRVRGAAGRDVRIILGPGHAPTEPAAEALRLLGLQSAWLFPLGNADSPAGAICLGYSSEPRLNEPDIWLIAMLLRPLGRFFLTTTTATTDAAVQLGQTQKMEALGSMAGMIAHDFNNLLTTILGYTSIVKNAGRLHPEDRECLDEVEDAAHKAASLTGRLLSFARGGLMQTGALDLRSVIADTLRLAQPALQHRVAITVDMPEMPVPIDGDESQLQQALLNLLLNARDAIADSGNVVIKLVVDATHATVTVTDDGPGMDATTRLRIFEPFFTTKPKGSGTGLGTSITYGIVKSHGGTIDVTSAPGQGTTFIIRLPALQKLPPESDRQLMSAADRDLILVVDDDEMVRRTTMATMAHLGFNVIDAPSGRLAIDLVRARPERFAVVLLDLVMPELTGAQTFQELRKIRPDLPVVVCTGYAAEDHLDQSLRRDIAGLVNKPFTADRLFEVVSALGVRPSRKRSGT
jgi:signal transduction histidine kinase/CheY-like chemotaxis protein